ncbi:MAG: hypothetical protein OEL53_07300 [Rhodospirillales bacterium]|nr:hypothetical protein [Rhodospirillales bacterium]
MAGDKVFARGQAYFQEGLVEILSMESGRVRAMVSGSQSYKTELTGRGKKIDGDCTCPAIVDWGFCKHLVAVALAVNDMISNGQSTGENVHDRIRRHLLSKNKEDLAEIILDLAERDAPLLRRLGMAASQSSENDAALLKRFKKAVTDATATRGFVDYRHAPKWAEGVEEVLNGIEELIGGNRAASLALDLIDHAILRIEGAIDNIDDSDGFCTDLMNQARDLHLKACKAAKPDPVALGKNLFLREVEGDWDAFHGSADAYADALGREGLAEFYRQASREWEKLPTLHGGKRARDEFSSRRRRLEGIMDSLAKRNGDIKARLAIRAKDLSSPWRYSELARFCLEQGMTDEALRWVEEGLWQFEDDPPDDRLVGLGVDLLLKAKRRKEAEALLWKTFERQPSLDRYQRLRKTGGKPIPDRAISFLKERLDKDKPASRGLAWAGVLVRILILEKRYAKAWEVARQYGVSDDLKESLALSSEKEFPEEALSIYAKRIDQMASMGGNANYEAAMKLVQRMAALQKPIEQAAYVQILKTRFKAKRNFMKLLDH